MKKKRSRVTSATEKLLKHYRGLKMKNPDLECFRFSFHLTVPSNCFGSKVRLRSDEVQQRAHAEKLKKNLRKFLNGYRRCSFSHVIKGYSWLLLQEHSGEPYIDISFFVSKADYTVKNGAELADFWMALVNPSRQRHSQKIKPEMAVLQTNDAEDTAAVLSDNFSFSFMALSRGHHRRIEDYRTLANRIRIEPLHGIQTSYRGIAAYSLLTLPGMRCFDCSKYKSNEE
ncbi:hypothetical protein [Serratia fonticola]